MMAWDGHCSFCAFWIERWKKMTRGLVNYRPYSEVIQDFPDIDIKAFQQAVRLIEPDGRVFSGAEAALRSFTYARSWGWLYPLYVEKKWFRRSCNFAYDWIAKHRSFMHSVTVIMFGKNPNRLKHYWLVYLLLLVFALICLLAPCG